MPRRPLAPALLTVLALLPPALPRAAAAADAVIGAKKLVLARARSGRTKLVLVARDAQVPSPALGSADDPTTAASGGLVVEVFTPSEPAARLTAPPVAGRPGWKVRKGVFRFANPQAPATPSPLRTVVLKPGRMLKIVALETGLALTGPLGQVSVRVTMGGVRRCVTFAGASVKRDRPGRFIGTDAPAGSGSCGDMGGGTTTTTTMAGGGTTSTTTPGGATTTTTAPGATTTTSTTTPGSTTTTTLVPGTPILDVTTSAGAGDCGEFRDGSASPIGAIACGGLDIGGGASSVPEGLIPDGATNRFVVGGCTGSSCSLAPTSTAGADYDCTATGCRFGPPLPIPNAGLSVCVVNTFGSDGGGTVDTSTGALSLVVPLSTAVHLTGNATQPCPRCSATGTPESPGVGTCDRGARAGEACTTTNGQGASADCLPGGGDGSAALGSIAVDLTPLATATATASDAAGLFCDGQDDAGCFGDPACRAIEVSGLAAGPLALDTPAAANLASTFCIPAVGNIVIDGAASLPGPGAASLSVTVTRRETPGGSTTTTTTMPGATTTTSTTTTTTTTTMLGATTTTTLLPALLPLTVEFMSLPPSGDCGSIRNGSGTTLAPLACGDLALGDGAGIIPATPLPDGTVVHFRLGGCSVIPLLTCALEAEDTPGAQHDCTDTGCFFGPPVPIPNGALSACSVNRFSAPASGSVNLLTGATSANVALALEVFVTGDAGQPCPVCSAVGAPGAPGTGTCDRGARAGLSCTSTNSQGLSRDCLPGGADGSVVAGTIGATLSPVTTGTVTRSNPSGAFCSGQATAGCFGNAACRSIVETGSAPGAAITSLLVPAPATLVSVFCVPATGSVVLDGPAGLPGPAAISLQGAVRASL